MDCLRKRFNRFYRFYRFSGGGAAHKNIEAPRSIHNVDARRLAFQSLATHPCFQTSNGMKKSGKMRLKQAINESTLSTAGAVPLPRWGRLRYESNAIPEIKPSPRGEGKEEAASPQKRKPTPPRCARQPLPREGARADTPSFLWKEVPRRGGGWMGIAV